MKFQNSLVLFLIFSLAGFSQNDSIFIPLNLKEAYKNGTRAMNGKPGENYWQNSANYDMEINFDPESRGLKGKSEITYFNNSPDTIKEIVIHTFPNIFQKGSARDRDIASADALDGVELQELKIGDEVVINHSRISDQFQVYSEATYMSIPLKKALLPNDQIELSVTWSYNLNYKTHLRTGQTSDTGFMVAYFFPRIAVYDDIEGWNKYAYTGNTEFYNDFGDYQVSIEVPQNYLVWATGQLNNPSEVLNDTYFQRYKQAQSSEQKITIIDTSDLGKAITKGEHSNSWIYSANEVPDFAFAIAKDYIWEARSLDVNRGNDQQLTIHTVYDPASEDFKQVNDFTRESIEYMTSVFPKVDFPYANHTVFNGLGMMEYPMMANDRSFEDLHRSRWLTHHETFHTYFPFLTGLNETKYAWLDEGLTMYGTNEYLRHINSPLQDEIGFQGFTDKIGYDSDFPIFAASRYLKNPTYFNNSYPKATAFYLVLRDYIGQENFVSFIQKFVETWKGKHPTAIDFLNMLKNSTTEDLSWLIKPWIFEFGYVDLSIENLTKTDKGYGIEIQKKGNYPAPIHLEIHFADGTSMELNESLEKWQNSNLNYVMHIETENEIKQIVLKDISLIDANPNNNVLKL